MPDTLIAQPQSCPEAFVEIETSNYLLVKSFPGRLLLVSEVQKRFLSLLVSVPNGCP